MIRKTLALTAAAALCMAAAPAQKTAPKPAPKAAAAKPVAAYDAGDPKGLVDLLTAAGAKVQSNRRDGDSVFVAFTSVAANFSIQFAGCNPSGRACQAALYDALVDRGAPTLTQINGFNQTSVVCRIYQDKAGKPHVTYAALVMKSDTRESGRTHLAAWQGCIAEALGFVRDPAGYLAVAP